jgi:hypothetical protein
MLDSCCGFSAGSIVCLIVPFAFEILMGKIDRGELKPVVFRLVWKEKCSDDDNLTPWTVERFGD